MSRESRTGGRTATLRRRREVERTREDILEAAARAIGRSGYRSATVRDIAREAGYTAASLYGYFKSKQEILEGLLALVSNKFLATFDEPVPSGLTFAQRVDLLVRRQLALIEEQRELFAMLMTLRPAVDMPKGRGEGGTRATGRWSPFWPVEMQVRRLAAWLRDNATRQDLRGHDPEDAARFLVSVGHGFTIHWVFHAPQGAGLGERTDLMLDLLFHGLAGAPTRRRDGATKK